jgi:Na+/glutamate symporter
LLLGRYIRRSVPFLRRIDIPDVVVGATIVAVLCLLADLLMGLQIRFGEETRGLASEASTAAIKEPSCVSALPLSPIVAGGS